MQDNFNDDVCILNQDLLAVESFLGREEGGYVGGWNVTPLKL